MHHTGRPQAAHQLVTPNSQFASRPTSSSATGNRNPRVNPTHGDGASMEMVHSGTRDGISKKRTGKHLPVHEHRSTNQHRRGSRVEGSKEGSPQIQKRNTAPPATTMLEGRVRGGKEIPRPRSESTSTPDLVMGVRSQGRRHLRPSSGRLQHWETGDRRPDPSFTDDPTRLSWTFQGGARSTGW